MSHSHDSQPVGSQGHGHAQTHADGDARGDAHRDAHGDAHRDAVSAVHGDSPRTPTGRLAGALTLTLTFMLVEAVAAYFTHSLALLSDALHMVTDAAALAFALAAQRIATRPRTRRRTYGFRRAETLAAFVNGVALGASSLWIVLEAVRRWSSPPGIHAWGMLGVAIAGLVANIVSAWVLSHGEHGHNANTRAALAHVLSDAAGSVAAIVAAVAIALFGWRQADAAASIVVAALILWGSWRLVRDAVDVLMEGTPPGVDPARLEASIRAVVGVADVHDVHAWVVADGFPAITAHVVLDGAAHGPDVARAVCARVADEFGVDHVTIQTEAPRPTDLVVPASQLTRTRAPS